MEKILKHPAIVTGVIVVITLFLGLQIPKVQLDNNNLRFLPERHEAKIIAMLDIAYTHIRHGDFLLYNKTAI